MNSFKKSLLLLSFIICQLYTNGSHLISLSLNYYYTGTPNTYLIRLKYYRDCFGIPANPSPLICVSSISCTFSDTLQLNPVFGTGQEVTIGPCFGPNTPSSCVGGSAWGVQEYVYEGIITLPFVCNDWKFEYSECCRDIAVSNVINGGNTSIYVFATLDNLNTPTNSSPDFLHLPVYQFCVNVNSNIYFTANDVDGDSITYEIDSALTSPTWCPYAPAGIPFATPYSINYPYSSSTPFILDSSGTLNFTPDLLGYAEVPVLVSEYRNGILISQTCREDFMVIINGVMATDEMAGKVYYDLNSNGILNTGEPGISNKIVEINPGPYYYSTSTLGDYDAYLPLGSFTASMGAPMPYYVYNPSVHTANFTAGYMTDFNNDFGCAAILNIQDLRITLTGFTVIPGSSSVLTLTASNVGTNTLNTTVNLNLDTMLSVTNTLPLAVSSSLHTASWTITNMQPLQFQNFSVHVDVNPLAMQGSYLNSFAEIQPLFSDTVPNDNIDSLNQLVVLAVDPNSKTVNPSGPLSVLQVNNGIYLEYTINFQNTGTSLVANVTVVDTLDLNFNIPTFEVLSSSHNYSWIISPSGIITFTFANINLPDSGTNEPASHAFIKYRIMPEQNLVVGNKVVNTAYVYFDSGLALATNYVSTTVLYPLGIIKTETGKNILIYPNPASHKINIDFGDEKYANVKLELFSITGQKVLEKNIKNMPDSITTDLDDLNTGIYFLQLSRGEKVYRTKIILE